MYPPMCTGAVVGASAVICQPPLVILETRSIWHNHTHNRVSTSEHVDQMPARLHEHEMCAALTLHRVSDLHHDVGGAPSPTRASHMC